MPFQKKIVEFINFSLKAGTLASVQPLDLMGIATSVVCRDDSDKVLVRPAIMDEQPRFIFPDDAYQVQVYHKAVANAYGSEVKKGFGDGVQYKHILEMQMIAILPAGFELEHLLAFGLPRALGSLQRDLGLTTCVIDPAGADLDTLRVFKTEFPNDDYFLADKAMLSFRYRITQTFDQACVNRCLCE